MSNLLKGLILGVILIGGYLIFFGIPERGIVFDDTWATGDVVGGELQFKYPQSLSLDYVSTGKWPPVVEVGNTGESSGCFLIPIKGKDYCVLESREGAAGSEYASYIYVGKKDDQIFTLKTAFRYVNCQNYFGDEESVNQCEREQESFSPNLLVDQIFNTIEKTQAPGFRLISPNGGEVFNIGLTYTISWDSGAASGYDKISVHIRKVSPQSQEEGQEFDPLIFVGIENDGAEDWVISDEYPEGEYILEATAYSELPLVDGNHISDESDAAFSIKGS